MKKFGLSVLALALGLVLSACGEKKTTETATETTTAEGENYEDPSIAMENQEKELKKVKITEQQDYAFVEPYLDEDSASAYAVVTNNSDQYVDLSETTVTFKKSDGTVAYVAESHQVDIAPYLLKPGEKAYVSASATLDFDIKEYGEADIKVSPMIAIDEVKSLPIEKDTMKPEEGGVYVNGIVKNNGKDSIDHTLIGAALYDEKGDFVATTFDNVDTPLSPGDSVGFESFTTGLPTEAIQKVKKYEVSASYYNEIQ
jgi:hypothetical protein